MFLPVCFSVVTVCPTFWKWPTPRVLGLAGQSSSRDFSTVSFFLYSQPGSSVPFLNWRLEQLISLPQCVHFLLGCHRDRILEIHIDEIKSLHNQTRKAPPFLTRSAILTYSWLVVWAMLESQGSLSRNHAAQMCFSWKYALTGFCSRMLAACPFETFWMGSFVTLKAESGPLGYILDF